MRSARNWSWIGSYGVSHGAATPKKRKTKNINRPNMPRGERRYSAQISRRAPARRGGRALAGVAGANETPDAGDAGGRGLLTALTSVGCAGRPVRTLGRPRGYTPARPGR